MSDQEETASIGCDVLDGKERDKNDATKSRDALVDIRQLKQDRTSAKRALTKKHNEIKQLIQNPNNASEISQKMLHLETAIEKFSNAHKLLHQNLHDEDDIQESNDYFNTEMDRITDLKQNVNECNERLMLVSDMHDVRPEDSVSSVELRQKSHARNISQRSMAGSNISGASTST